MIKQIKQEIEQVKSDMQKRLSPDNIMYYNQLMKAYKFMEHEEKSVDEHITDEFNDAEHYLAWYMNTRDKRLLDAAHDEMSHGMILIDIYEKQGHPVGNMRGWGMDLQRRIKTA